MTNERKIDSMQAAHFISGLTDSELMTLGTDDMAYVKPVVVHGTHAYAIHSADGAQLAVVPNRAVAFATVRDNDLDPVSVH